MGGHADVDVPSALRGRLGCLLAGFEQYLAARGYAARRMRKPPGGHVTPFWVYARLNAALAKEVQFGETERGRAATTCFWFALSFLNNMFEYEENVRAMDVIQ